MSVLKRGANEPVHEFQTRRRQQAAHLFETTDLSIAEIARRIGVTRKYVSKWHTAWEQGSDRFLTAEQSGGQSRLTDEQKQLIAQKITQGAVAAGYDQDLWTQKRIAALILKETGINYHPNFIRVLMASMQISYQKPALQPRERNEEKRAHFTDVTFPEVKKGHSKAEQP